MTRYRLALVVIVVLTGWVMNYGALKYYGSSWTVLPVALNSAMIGYAGMRLYLHRRPVKTP